MSGEGRENKKIPISLCNHEAPAVLFSGQISLVTGRHLNVVDGIKCFAVKEMASFSRSKGSRSGKFYYINRIKVKRVLFTQ